MKCKFKASLDNYKITYVFQLSNMIVYSEFSKHRISPSIRKVKVSFLQRFHFHIFHFHNFVWILAKKKLKLVKRVKMSSNKGNGDKTPRQSRQQIFKNLFLLLNIDFHLTDGKNMKLIFWVIWLNIQPMVFTLV